MTTSTDNLMQIDVSTAYRRQFSLRRTARRPYKSVATTLPFPVIELAARIRGLDIDDFIETFDVEFFYDGNEGAFLRFVENSETKRTS